MINPPILLYFQDLMMAALIQTKNKNKNQRTKQYICSKKEQLTQKHKHVAQYYPITSQNNLPDHNLLLLVLVLLLPLLPPCSNPPSTKKNLLLTPPTTPHKKTTCRRDHLVKVVRFYELLLNLKSLKNYFLTLKIVLKNRLKIIFLP